MTIQGRSPIQHVARSVLDVDSMSTRWRWSCVLAAGCGSSTGVLFDAWDTPDAASSAGDDAHSVADVDGDPVIDAGATAASDAGPGTALPQCDGCQPIEPPADDWSAEIPEGDTACPRAESIVQAHDDGQPELLCVRGASTAQWHSEEMTVFLSGPERADGGGSPVAWLSYFAHGAGTYEVGGDELPCDSTECDDPFAAIALRNVGDFPFTGVRGSGTLIIESDVHLDTFITVGSVDVLFEDDTRLLADFVAPLTMTE